MNPSLVMMKEGCCARSLCANTIQYNMFISFPERDLPTNLQNSLKPIDQYMCLC